MGILARQHMPFPVEIRENVRTDQGSQCSLCGSYFPNLEVHHKIPSSKGGSDYLENAVGLCGVCHDMVDSFQQRDISYEEAYAQLVVYFGPGNGC